MGKFPDPFSWKKQIALHIGVFRVVGLGVEGHQQQRVVAGIPDRMGDAGRNGELIDGIGGPEISANPFSSHSRTRAGP